MVDWDVWVKGPGMPPVELDFTTKKLNSSKALAQDYISRGGDSSPGNFEDYVSYNTNLRAIFIDTLNTQEA